MYSMLRLTLAACFLSSLAFAGLGTLRVGFQEVLTTLGRSADKMGLLTRGGSGTHLSRVGEVNGQIVEIAVYGSLTRGAPVNNAVIELALMTRNGESINGSADAMGEALIRVLSDRAVTKQIRTASEFRSAHFGTDVEGVMIGTADLSEQQIRVISEALESVVNTYRTSGFEGLRKLGAKQGTPDTPYSF